MSLHDRDELRCPRCGASVERDIGTVMIKDYDAQMQTKMDCPECDSPLNLVIESAGLEALGLNIWLEDRRDKG